MKSNRLFFYLIAVMAITSFATIALYNPLTVENIILVNMSVKISDYFGLNANPGEINFGTVIPGTTGERSITLENNSSKTLKVIIILDGPISDWIYVPEKSLIMEPNSRRNITFQVNPGSSANFGAYTGQAKFIFKKAYFYS
jgi:hypothetical protein